MPGEGAFRGGVLRCPACAGGMDERALSGAMVDVCPGCQGLWLDWFDGDVATLVRETGSPRTYVASGGAGGSGQCPRCGVDLAAGALPIDDAEGGNVGPEVLRCGDCQGVFVPRSAAEIVLGLGMRTSLVVNEPSFFARLLQALRELFGGRPGVDG